MEFVKWEESLETGLPEVDRQHHHLIDVTNQFGVLLSQDRVSPDDVEKLLQELVAYAQYHFKEEEELMESAGIDLRHLDQHKKIHQSFFQDVGALQKQWLSGKNVSYEKLFEYLVNWLVFHILGSDKNLARQIDAINTGLTAEQAYAEQEKDLDPSTKTLLRSVKNLFNQVSSQNKELIDLNQSLEQNVEARTHDLQKANLELERLSTTDTLTGLYNRRYAMFALERLWDEVDVAGLGCMLIDADHFKEVNDNYGHDAGDIVLRELAKQLQYPLRTDDIVCRLGGDEFLVICPGTSQKGLVYIANQMHQHIKNLRIEFQGGSWSGSISVGLAVKSEEMSALEDLIKLADKGVYAAKEAGKNCIKFGL